jgi:hypothetical protein
VAPNTIVVKNINTSVLLTKIRLNKNTYYSFRGDPVCIPIAKPNAIAPLIQPAKDIIDDSYLEINFSFPRLNKIKLL